MNNLLSLHHEPSECRLALGQLSGKASPTAHTDGEPHQCPTSLPDHSNSECSVVRLATSASMFYMLLLLRFFPAKGYTKEHELVHLDESTGVGTISITDHAQSVLGDVVFVELPKIGTQVSQGGM